MTNPNTTTVRLAGRIDSGNAAQTEEAILAQLAGKDARGRRFDPKAATYWTQHDNRDTAARYQKGY